MKIKLINDFVELKDKIEEFKTEYDIKISDAQLKNVQLSNRMEAFKAERGLKVLIFVILMKTDNGLRSYLKYLSMI